MMMEFFGHCSLIESYSLTFSLKHLLRRQPQIRETRRHYLISPPKKLCLICLLH